jgi:hypothetical protein
MAEPKSFVELVAQGQSAYERFYGLVTDPQALAQWRAGAEGPQLDMIVEFTRRASELPPPAGDLPLSIVANIACHASIGSLGEHRSLTAATGLHDLTEPLEGWYSTTLTRLQRVTPESLQSEILWIGYTPGFSYDVLATRAASFASQVAPDQTFAGPLAVLVVLLRDSVGDLEPWLAEHGYSVENWIWNAADLAPRDQTRPDEWELGDVATPREAFQALARLGQLRSLALPEIGPAPDTPPTPDTSPTPDTPPTPRVDHPGRPSTTVSSDLSTDEDQLEYALYADAIASFIRDERTRAPLTIGIKAPWGAGKTSLMKMIRKRLDPNPPRPQADAPRLKIKDLWRQTRHKSPEEAADALEPEHLDPGERRTTIWFNAWKYQSGEQLWAGLAHAILTQASDRLEPVDRDRLWASLQLRRVSTDRVRRRFYSYVALRLIPWAIAIPIAALVVAVVGLVDESLVPGASILGGIVVVGGAIVSTLRAGWDEVAKATPQLVQAPDYESRLGFLHLVDTDMRRILEVAGATADRPFVVFVDDLDRCSYTTVAQVIEALNVFLAGDFDNCVFVIAMEPDLVAAQIHVAYEKLFEQLDDHGDDLGWRFLEKMVQLPLSLPEPQAPQVERFLDSILAIRTEQQIAEIADDAPEVLQARELIKAAETTGTLEGVGDAYEEVRKSYPVQGVLADAIVQKAARLEFADRFDDSTARDMLLRFAKDLSGNPREIKRFVNVFRFYAYIDFWRRTQDLETPGLDGAGKLARLAIGWPSLLSTLAPLLQTLETTSDAEWLDVALAAPVRVRDKLANDALRDVIRGEPHIGAAASSFL